MSLSTLGMLYQAQGRYAEAEPLCEQALLLMRESLGERHPHTLTSLNNLGLLYRAQGRYAEAEPLYEQALRLRRESLGERHPHTLISLNNLASLRAAVGQLGEALALRGEAAAIERSLIGAMLGGTSERGRAAYLATFEGNLDAFLSLVLAHFSSDPGAVSAALDVVLSRKALLAETLAAQRDAVLGGRYPDLAPRLAALTALRSRIAENTLAGPAAGEDPEAHRRSLEQWTKERDGLEAELARAIPEMRLEERLKGADARAIALAIPDSGTLVEFVRFDVLDFKAIPARGERRWKEARYLAFLIPAGAPDGVRMIDLGEAEPIDWLIAWFRAQVTRDVGELKRRGAPYADEDTEVGEDPGAALRRLVFDPIAPVTSRRLLLAPDGELTRLPFEVLPLADGRPLVEDYAISYLATGRDVIRTGAERTAEPGVAIVAADPDYDLGTAAVSVATTAVSSQGRAWREGGHAQPLQRLAGTRIEGRRVAALLGAEAWFDRAALERRLKRRRSPSVLHIATHGLFLPDPKRDPEQMTRIAMIGGGGRLQRLAGQDNPLLRSGLALAGVNTWMFARGGLPEDAEDGLLTAEDVMGLDLLDTELVVLSACDTGLGEIRVGEGVMGLRRSFIVAGARTLIMSLWKVPDEATAILMSRLYENLLGIRRGERFPPLPRHEALREAQHYLRTLTLGALRRLRAEAAAADEAGGNDKAKGNNEAKGDDDRARGLAQPTQTLPDDHRPFAHPYFWGAFICQGKTEPMESGTLTPGTGATDVDTPPEAGVVPKRGGLFRRLRAWTGR